MRGQTLVDAAQVRHFIVSPARVRRRTIHAVVIGCQGALQRDGELTVAWQAYVGDQECGRTGIEICVVTEESRPERSDVLGSFHLGVVVVVNGSVLPERVERGGQA